MDHDMTEAAVGAEIHVQDGQTAADLSFCRLLPVDHLGSAGHSFHPVLTDLQIGYDHPRHENGIVSLFLDGETCECQIQDIPLVEFPEAGVLEMDGGSGSETQTGRAESFASCSAGFSDAEVPAPVPFPVNRPSDEDSGKVRRR